MELVKAVKPEDPIKSIGQFFDTIFGQQRGFVYSPIKEWSKERDWKTYFFRWPEEREELVEHVLTKSKDHDVYYAPALLNSKQVPQSKYPEIFAGSYWVWAEFDYGIPQGDKLKEFNLPNPNIRIRTSDPGHEHWYWRIDHWQENPEVLRDITQRLAYALDADVCFDWGRVLRVPYTIHHESKLSVKLLTVNNGYSAYSVFDKVPQVENTPLEDIDLGEVPQTMNVLLKYKFPEDTIDLLLKNSSRLQPKDGKSGSRSSALMRLGYDCAEIGMSNEEIFSILKNRDDQWKKYTGSGDRQIKQLLKIINRARITYPYNLPEDLTTDYPVMSVIDLSNANIHIEWIIDDLIHKNGLWMITGESESGKSQLAIWLCIHIALGRMALERWNAEGPQKIMFVSMEMNGAELKEITTEMLQHFSSDEEKVLLHENFLVVPLGSSIPLDKHNYQLVVNQLIDKYQPTGIIFDSLGIAIADDLKDSTPVNAVFAYLKRALNQERGCHVGFIHHNTKPKEGRKTVRKEDVYGSAYIVNHVRTIINLTRTGKDAFSPIEVDCLKLSLRPNFKSFKIKRTVPLGFEVHESKGFGTEVTDDDIKKMTNFSMEGSIKNDLPRGFDLD